MARVVLDASAMLAIIRREPGADMVMPLLSNSVMSAVNFTEVLKRGMDNGGSPALTKALFENVGLPIIPFDDIQALICAEISPQTRDLGLSLADRACLGLGIQMNTKVYTADQRMSQAMLPIDIILIRQPL